LPGSQNEEREESGFLREDKRLKPRFENPVAIPTLAFAFLLLTLCFVVGGCRARKVDGGPVVEFTKVPLAEEGGPDKLDVIEGRVREARPDQKIVLFAKSGTWYVQPFADQQFTAIQADSKWKSVTHLGTEYAALLVEPGYQPPNVTDTLPTAGGAVVAVAIRKGEPVYWLRWWFLVLCALALLSTFLAFNNYKLHLVTRQLNLRFEERLAERTQIAQQLHDTLLQGVISASMQLHMAVDQLPTDLPAKPSLTRVLHVMEQVLEEGRYALQSLRPGPNSVCLDIEQTFRTIQQEFNDDAIDFRVIVEGRPRPVHPIIRDEVYRIGRELLVSAFRAERVRSIIVDVKYRATYLCIAFLIDGGRDNNQTRAPEGDGQWPVSEMREGADRIGGRLRVKHGARTEVELLVPGYIAFQSQSARNALSWLARFRPQGWDR